MILLSLKYFESKPSDDDSLPTYAYHETPQVFEEPTIPLRPCPPPFPVPIWVPPGDDIKVRKSQNRIIDLSIQPPPNSHDSNPIEDNLEWFRNYMEPKVKVDPLLFNNHINVHVPNIEVDPIENKISSRDTFQPLPSTSHDLLFHDLLDQPTSTCNDGRLVISRSNREKGSCIS